MTAPLNRHLTVGQYTPTPAFKAIENHSCVCYADDLGLVALTGPAADMDSQRYADLFAAAPDMLDTLKRTARWLEETHASMGDECAAEVLADIETAIVLAEGSAVAKSEGGAL
jgi:hypothetical protein